jgi:tubulin-folding cofactor B
MPMNNHDLIALKNYINAGDEYKNLHPDTLVLDLSHSNLTQRHIEIRFDKHTTISTLRDKIYQKTGTPPHYQHLQLQSGNQILCEIPPTTESERMLGYYSLSHGMSCHCIDVDPHSGSKGGAYEDTSLVKRYVMSDEDYDKRNGTLRDWGRKQKEKDENFTLAKHAKEHRELMDAQRLGKLGLDLPKGFAYDDAGKVVRDEADVVNDKENENCNANANANCCSDGDCEKEEHEYGPATVDGMAADMRCEVRPGERRGKVAFVGEVSELGSGGYWVGVIFDEPVGKTDGTVAKNGKRYFEAPGPQYGGFVRGTNVQVGEEFGERDIFDDSSDDDEDEL